jgi:adenylate cyclase
LVVRGSVESASARIAEACETCLKAAALGPDNGSILATAAWTISMLGGLHQQGREFAERALKLHPNSADVRTACGWSLIFGGEPERALAHFEVARRLSPLDPRTFVTQTATASAKFFQMKFDEAVDWSTRVLDQKPTWTAALRYRAAALAHLGRIEDARADVAQVLEIQPTCNLRWVMIYKYRDQWMRELFSDGLRLAGLPE